MSGPSWKLEDDFKTVTVSFPSTPPVALRMDVSEVESMLKNLGEFRSLMKPEITQDLAMGQKIGAVPDPKWVTEPDALMGNSILHVRDPRFGWLHYLIPKPEALKLAGFLQTQAESPPPGQGSGKPN